jgi:hypothetical protein
MFEYIVIRKTRTRCYSAGEQHSSKGTRKLRLITRNGVSRLLIRITKNMNRLKMKRHVMIFYVGSFYSLCRQIIRHTAITVSRHQ